MFFAIYIYIYIYNNNSNINKINSINIYIYIYTVDKFHIKPAIESSPSTHLSSKPQPSDGRAHGVVGGQAICVVGQHGLAMRPLADVESNGIKYPFWDAQVMGVT